MALFGMGKKKDSGAPAEHGGFPAQPDAPMPPGGTPVEQVLTLQRQGMSNYQIVQALQQQGFSSQQVFDAMNQASIKGGVNPSQSDELLPPEGMLQGPTGGPPTSQAPQQMQQQAQQQPMPGGMQMPGGMPMPPMPPSPRAAEGIEETVEAVVEEKWREISSTISKLNEWKESTDSKINKLQQAVADTKSDMDNLHKAIVSKIGEYDQNLLNVGTEIKAMEKVFSKVLPTFTENINELSRVTKNIKTSSKK